MSLPQVKIPRFSVDLLSADKQLHGRKFTVGEELIIQEAKESDKITAVMDAVEQVLTQCFDNLDRFNDLTVYDVEYILTVLRTKSVEEDLKLKEFPCPECKAPILNPTVDLVEDMIIENKKHVARMEVELSGNIIVGLQAPTIGFLRTWIAEADQTTKSDKYNYDVIADCIEYVKNGDETFTDETHDAKKEWILQLDRDNLIKVMDFFRQLPVIRFEKKLVCPKCKHEIKKEYKLKSLFF